MGRVGLGVILLLLGLGGCSQPSEPVASGLAGAYLGEGKFHGAQGSLDAKAQLNLEPGGAYQLLWLEPSPLAIVGVERGSWLKSNETITLTPKKQVPKEGDGTFARLSASSSESATTKTLVYQGSGLAWSDGKMDLVFRRQD